MLTLDTSFKIDPEIIAETFLFDLREHLPYSIKFVVGDVEITKGHGFGVQIRIPIVASIEEFNGVSKNFYGEVYPRDIKKGILCNPMIRIVSQHDSLYTMLTADQKVTRKLAKKITESPQYQLELDEPLYSKDQEHLIQQIEQHLNEKVKIVKVKGFHRSFLNGEKDALKIKNTLFEIKDLYFFKTRKILNGLSQLYPLTKCVGAHFKVDLDSETYKLILPGIKLSGFHSTLTDVRSLNKEIDNLHKSLKTFSFSEIPLVTFKQIKEQYYKYSNVNLLKLTKRISRYLLNCQFEFEALSVIVGIEKNNQYRCDFKLTFSNKQSIYVPNRILNETLFKKIQVLEPTKDKMEAIRLVSDAVESMV